MFTEPRELLNATPAGVGSHQNVIIFFKHLMPPASSQVCLFSIRSVTSGSYAKEYELKNW